MDNDKKKRPVTTRTSRSHWTTEDWHEHNAAMDVAYREVMEDLGGAQAEAWQMSREYEAIQAEGHIKRILNRFKRIFQR